MLPYPLAIVDLETTGVGLARDRITEIGICLVDEGCLTEEWSTLVNPEVAISPFITQHTGITNEMVKDAPRFANVMEDVLYRLDGRVVVAHNAGFDYGFLKSEFIRHGISFQAKSLCTVKLSRALYPKERRHGLDALIERFSLTCASRHRALDDARAVWHLLQALFAEVEHDRINEAARTILKRPSTPPNLPNQNLDALPRTPGVYRFYGENDALLYVGKSTNIRSRVMGHFSAASSDQKEMRLTRQVRRIEHQETAGELGALLLEARQVKELQPLLNRKLRRSTNACSLVLERTREGFLRPQMLNLGKCADDDSDELYGLFHGKKEVESYLRGLIDEHGLCAKLLGVEKGAGACFSHQVKKCRGACVGKESHQMHDTRLLLHLSRMKVKSWPFKGRIGVREHNRDTDRSDLHIFQNWCYLGTIQSPDEIEDFGNGNLPVSFDMDCYKILSGFLNRNVAGLSVVEL